MAKVTQLMIAERLGVSRTAVAYALGMYRGVNVSIRKDMVERIKKTANEMGYRPNRFAQLITGKTKSGVIGVLSFGGVGQMAVQRNRAISIAIQEAGYDVALHDIAWHGRKNIARIVHTMLDSYVEGLILIEPAIWFDFSLLDEFKKHGIPVVFVNGVIQKEFPFIGVNEYEGMHSLTTQLIQRGSHRFIFLCPATDNYPSREFSPLTRRIAGFNDAIEQAGGNIVKKFSAQLKKNQITGILFQTKETVDWDDPYAIGYHATAEILQKNPLPDVLLCLNDDWSIGALRACTEAKIRVPEDIKVAGDDGICMAAYGSTPLTTVLQPTTAMSIAAVETIKKLLANKKLTNKVLRLSPTIEWRRSTENIKE